MSKSTLYKVYLATLDKGCITVILLNELLEGGTSLSSVASTSKNSIWIANMKTKHFTTSFLVDQSPTQVFKAITNVRGWWQGLYEEEIIGKTHALHDEFSFRAGGGMHYSKQKLIELIPDKKVVWLVTESELSFVEKKNEWQGTKIIFDLSQKGNKTLVRFTHEGLNPEIECYDSCSSAWQNYLDQKFLPLIKAQV